VIAKRLGHSQTAVEVLIKIIILLKVHDCREMGAKKGERRDRDIQFLSVTICIILIQVSFDKTTHNFLWAERLHLEC